MNRKVVVTGMGIVSPLRPLEGITKFWHALCSGEDAIKMMRAPFLNLDGEWPMAAIDENIFPEHLRIEDKIGFIANEALNMAINDSGLNSSSILNDRPIGLSVGTVLGNILCKESKLIDSRLEGSNGNLNKQFNNCNDSLASVTTNLAELCGLTGPAITVSTACASGTDAIGIAARKIEMEQCEIMIAGGVDVLSDFAIAGFHSLQAITKDKIRPFDRDRDGLALGEGAAFIVLESESHAVERGSNIYGRVLGYASRSDANHLTGPHKEGRGLSEAIKAALSDAKTEYSDVDYINAHGTGTVYNDLMETKAIKNVFGKLAYNIPISSTKSMLGHSFGAAGAIEAICCLLAVNEGLIPPTINFNERDAECDLNYTPNAAIERRVRQSISQSAGFGGQNSAIVFAEA